MLTRLVRAGFLMSCVALPCSMAAASAEVGLRLVNKPDGTAYNRVIDIRDLKDCEHSSFPQGRCLPADNFVDPTGRVISFHALRWLLGTVGLSGSESVLVVGDKPGAVQAVGALLFLAGQKQVDVLQAPFAPELNTHSGGGRSLSREAVFTAPMRDAYVLTRSLGDARTATPPQERLAHFALALGRGDRTARITMALDQ